MTRVARRRDRPPASPGTGILGRGWLRGTLLVLLWLLGSIPAVQAAGRFAGAHDVARLATPPEPLSPWAALDAEIERLVARGELPLEAWSFRPNDRGEIAAWLFLGTRHRERSCARQVAVAAIPECSSVVGAPRTAAGRPAPGPARSRLAAVLRWEQQRWLTPAPLQYRPPARPGALLRFGSGEALLHLSPYLRLMPRFAEDEKPEWTDASRVGVRAQLTWANDLAISTGLFAAEIKDGRSFADPLIAGTDFILHEEEATLSARWGPLRFRAGRDRHRWGPGISGTLLLSDAAQPFNFVEYQVRLADDLRFLALSGVTSRNAAAADGAGDEAVSPYRHRYLAAHRLLWNVTPDFAVAFCEAARYQDDAPHWLYLSGIVPYTLIERFDIQDERAGGATDVLRNNVLWSCDATWRLRPGWLIYAELLADDIATQSAQMPTRGGFQIGTTWAPRWHGWEWTLGAEFTKVSNYTYSVYYQDQCQCDWEHQGDPLGYALGPDVENLLLRCAVDPHPRWGLSGWLQHGRKGAGAIGQPWRPAATGCCPQCDPGCGDVDAWSLEGPITRILAVGGLARYRPSALLWVGASLEVRRTRGSAGDEDPRVDGRRTSETDAVLRTYLSLGGS